MRLYCTIQDARLRSLQTLSHRREFPLQTAKLRPSQIFPITESSPLQTAKNFPFNAYLPHRYCYFSAHRGLFYRLYEVGNLLPFFGAKLIPILGVTEGNCQAHRSVKSANFANFPIVQPTEDTRTQALRRRFRRDISGKRRENI